MRKQKLKIDFVDFGGINKNKNYFTNILSRRFDIEISDKPDLLLYKEIGHINRLYTCKKIFVTGESLLPDWERADYSITCHHIDNPRHLRLPYYVWGTSNPVSKLIKLHNEINDAHKLKSKVCSTVISNANPKRTKERISFFKKLSSHMPIDSGGSFMNNVGPIGEGENSKLQFISQYKFNLCFENKSIDGYTTEKLTDAMMARCIPIYWGNNRIGEEFNKKSFLHRNDYPSDESFIQRIMEVHFNESLFQEIMREPYFHNNTPNIYYNEDRILDFFQYVLDDSKTPISKQKKIFRLGRWTLAKKQAI